MSNQVLGSCSAALHRTTSGLSFPANTQYGSHHGYSRKNVKHPIRGDALTELETFLWRSRMVAHEAQTMMRGLNHFPDAAAALNDDLFFSLTNHALIIVCKFLEVWDDSNSLSKLDLRIIPMRKAVTPFVHRIQVWTGLRSMRNSALAHAYLDKDGNLVAPWQQIAGGAAPSYHAEIILLLQLVYLSVLVILTVFESEYRLIDPLCGPGDVRILPKGPGISLGTEIEGVLKPIAARVERSLNEELGLTVQGPLLKAFKNATRPQGT
jgi:hypothetical protein